MAFETKKILVIDDDYEVVEFVKAVLRTKGYDVVVAYDGETGLEQIVSNKPDLVITDLRMPGMSGMELIKRIRKDPDISATPLLVMSSITQGTDKPDHYWAMGLGSDDFIPKPFDPLGLLGRVEYLLRKNEYRSASGAVASESTGQVRDAGSAARVPKEELDPGAVVKVFVESWNTRDFVAEYETLGEEMLGGLSCQDYVQRRAQLYADEGGESTRHTVVDLDAKITHNLASVACLREDIVKEIPRRKDERYTLKKTPKGWKIVSVKSRPMTFTIES